jgi:hypothetical protein
VSLALTWPRRLCLLRVLLCVSLCYKLSPFQAHSGRWHCMCFLRPVCLFTAHVGSGSFPLSCGVFPLCYSHMLSHSLFLGALPRSCRSLSGPPGLFIYSSGKNSFPPVFGPQCTPPLFPMCLYCSYCLLLSFSFFPGWRSVCPGGYAALAQGCLWEYHGTAKLTLSASSQDVWWPGGPPGFSF